MLSLKTGGARAAQFATRRLLSESQNNDFDGEEIEGQALYRWLSMTLGENPTKMLGESKYVGSFVFSALFQENKSFYIIKRTFTYPNIIPYAQD